MRYVRCPTCGTQMPDPDHMDPAELKAIRGIVGVKLKYQGPMPLTKFARLLKVSPRALDYYLAGKRVHPDGRTTAVDIPPLVAEKARELKNAQASAIPFPKKWEEQRVRMLNRRARFRAARDRRNAATEPPF